MIGKRHGGNLVTVAMAPAQDDKADHPEGKGERDDPDDHAQADCYATLDEHRNERERPDQEEGSRPSNRSPHRSSQPQAGT
jgi:hypothetical protein